jgi:XTP/dITP diphosphohydrolase
VESGEWRESEGPIHPTIRPKSFFIKNHNLALSLSPLPSPLSPIPSPMLILGTANHKKGLELAELFRPVGVELRTLADFNVDFQVAENGDTFQANARLKAIGYAQHLGQWVLADDSGLLVDALDGAPGVYSARFSGPDGDDEANNRLVLEKLGNLPIEKRSAQFVCHIAVSDPTGKVWAESNAACRGRILFSPRGSNGFGYDPLFEIVEYHRSFAEFGPLVKSNLSHRSRAARRVIPQLIRLADEHEI